MVHVCDTPVTVEMTVIVSQTNVREHKRDIQEWTTRDIGNIGHTGHNTKTNETKTKKTTQHNFFLKDEHHERHQNKEMIQA